MIDDQLIRLKSLDFWVDFHHLPDISLLNSFKGYSRKYVLIELRAIDRSRNIEITSYLVLSSNIGHLTQVIHLILSNIAHKMLENPSNHHHYHTCRTPKSSLRGTSFVVDKFFFRGFRKSRLWQEPTIKCDFDFDFFYVFMLIFKAIFNRILDCVLYKGIFLISSLLNMLLIPTINIFPIALNLRRSNFKDNLWCIIALRIFDLSIRVEVIIECDG